MVGASLEYGGTSSRASTPEDGERLGQGAVGAKVWRPSRRGHPFNAFFSSPKPDHTQAEGLASTSWWKDGQRICRHVLNPVQLRQRIAWKQDERWKRKRLLNTQIPSHRQSMGHPTPEGGFVGFPKWWNHDHWRLGRVKIFHPFFKLSNSNVS